MLSFFDADFASPLGCPQSPWDIIITSLLFAFFGVMMFIGAIRYEMTYDKVATWWKWSFAPLAVAAVLGLQRVVFLFNFGYANTVINRKLQYCHWLALIIPLMCICSIILYKWLKHRNQERRVY